MITGSLFSLINLPGSLINLPGSLTNLIKKLFNMQQDFLFLMIIIGFNAINNIIGFNAINNSDC